MNYFGMPQGMWLLYEGSFRRNLTAVLGFDRETADRVARMAKPTYREIIGRLPAFEKGDRFRMNIVNCALFSAFLLHMPERPSVEKLADYYEAAMCRLDYAMTEAGGASVFVREFTLYKERVTMKEKKKSDVAVLLGYAGSYRGLTFLGLALSAVAMVLGMLPYICIWLAVRDLIAVAPDWTRAAGVERYGWMAFASAMGGIAVYFCALMCTHLAAFRTATNIRKQGMAHLMKTPLGWFDANASGLIRNRLDGAAAETETLLAHNLADIVGTAAMFLSTLALMFAFDWRMGAACLLAPRALQSGNFAAFVTNFAFYAVFSAIVSTALARIMFAASGTMLAHTALGRIEQVMNAPTLAIAPEAQTPKDNGVEFKDVSFTYDGADIPALSHVSFRVEPGQTVALVGPSGGGKTTAASLIPRFWDVTDGAVEVGGVDVRRADPRVLMNDVAFVFQNNRLFKASILDNVRAARPDATREEAMAALQAAQCGDILAKLPNGAETVIGTEGTYLSGGEQQRVALARAILKNAPIVVLDEATAFADPENEALIQKAFAKLTEGRTVIMIAHRLSTVVRADKIIVLDAGKVVEEGTHDELVRANGLYARMWADYNRAVSWKISA